MLYDFTDELCNKDRSWARGGQRFLEQFSTSAQETRVGLYVLVHSNESQYAIYDRNGDGRIVVGANSVGVKYGKFEQGFLARRFTDHKHFHRKLEDGSEEVDIFASVLRYALVLDLSDINLAPANPAAVFESYWNAMLESALKAKGWVASNQSAQSESRHIVSGVAWTALRSELAAFAPALGRCIRDAAAVLVRARQPQV